MYPPEWWVTHPSPIEWLEPFGRKPKRDREDWPLSKPERWARLRCAERKLQEISRQARHAAAVWVNGSAQGPEISSLAKKTRNASWVSAWKFWDSNHYHGWVNITCVVYRSGVSSSKLGPSRPI